jgi:cobalamin biosynthetic protein CobC
MLEHGGNLMAASQRYGLPLEHWLDLSTGINPTGHPVPPIPVDAWLHLPQDDDGLLDAAASFYGTMNLIAAAGTQAVLQTLPRLRPACRVAIPAPMYAEHPRAWTICGHQVVRHAPEDILAAECDVLLLCNPNNPTGHRYARNALLACRDRLQTRGGWLIVDEAFIDCRPDESVTPLTGEPGLIVLRSLGKFFGLAGARVGFAFGWPALLAELAEMLGPWPISGPARIAAQAALRDKPWQTNTRIRLRQDAQRLMQLLAECGLAPAGGTELFQYVPTPQAEKLHEHLAQQGILARLFHQPPALRFGLPATEAEWQRLQHALTGYPRS